MKINEIQNPVKIGIKTTKQNIDQKIKVPAPFFQKPSVYVIAGAMGSGKSTLVNSLMTGKGENQVFRGVFERVHYATPEEVFTSDENHPMKKHNPNHLHHELTPNLLVSIMESAIDEKADGGATMVVLDDYGEILKNKHIEPLLKRMVQKHRHLKINLIITVISLKLLPRSIRSLVDMYFIFKPKNKLEVEDYVENVFSLPKKDYEHVYDAVYKEKHDFMIYNQRDHEFYRNFNRLEITGD